jgi:hypothetical protein
MTFTSWLSATLIIAVQVGATRGGTNLALLDRSRSFIMMAFQAVFLTIAVLFVIVLTIVVLIIGVLIIVAIVTPL